MLHLIGRPRSRANHAGRGRGGDQRRDDYAKGLRVAAARRQVEDLTAKVAEQPVGHEIVDAVDDDKAKVYQKVFATAVTLPGKTSVSTSDGGVTVSALDSVSPGGGATVNA